MPLGRALTLKRGYDLPSRLRVPGPYPIVSSSGPSGHHEASKAEAPGIVTGRYGTLGQVYWVTTPYWPLNTALYVSGFKDNEPRFLYYLLSSLDLAHFNDKSGVPGLNRNDLHDLDVVLPPISEQRAIASVLGSLDDKIAANRKLIATLEATCECLFRSWFVDFDPVIAKLSGSEPAHLSAAISALFPARLVDSPLGPIPDGWRVARLKELAVKIGSGATPRGGKSVYVPEGVALIRSQNVYDSTFHWDGLARITDAAAERLASVAVVKDDVLLNITGASILRTCVVDPSVLPARVNQHVMLVRAKAGIPSHFLHQNLLKPETKDYLLGMDAGGSREAVTKGHVESVPLVLPDSRLLEHFAQVTHPLLALSEASSRESRTLATLRDLLLPRLLSGELQIRDAAELVEEAV